MRKTRVFAFAALFTATLFADGETHYYLRGSDDAKDKSAFDGHGGTVGWASTPGGAKTADGATDATGIYHVNGFILRAKLSGNAYTFQGGELLFDKAGSAINNKMASNATLTIGNLRVTSGVHAELRQGDKGNTSKWAGANWVVEEGATLGFSLAESEKRYHVSSATITGRGLVALTSGIDGASATGGSLTLNGGLAGFEGFLSAYERGATFTGTYAAGVSGKQLVIADSAGFPQATPNGALLERSIIVTNGATISFTCDVTSPIMRGWDFGDGTQPTVNVDAGKAVYIHGPVKGSAGFKKTGDGMLILNVGGAGAYDTITLAGASTVSAATLSAYVEKCDQWIYDTFLAGLNASVPEAVATACNSLTLSARVNCLGGKTATVKFAYGISPDALTGTNAASASATEAAPTVQATITRLTPGVAYYVKAIAETDGEEPETCESGIACIQTAPSPDRPAGYTFFDYISVSGTQYINTGLRPSNALRVVETFSTTDSTVDKMLFGVRNAGYNFICWTGNNPATSITPNLGTSGGVGSAQTGKSAGQKWTIDFGIDGIYADGAELFSPSAYASYRTDAVSTQPLILFGLSNNGTIDNRKFIGKCYAFKAYEGGVLVRDLVPARRDLDGAVGMYDLCGQVFYENLGTGVFSAGPKRQPAFTIAENISGGALASVSLSFASASSARTLKVAIGPAYGGDAPAGWAATETIATIAPGATGATWTPPADWGSDQKLVARFYFDDTPAVWSDSVFWHDYATPSLANVVADGSGGDTLVVSGNLASFSGPNCVLTILTGGSVSTATNVWPGATRTSPGTFSFTLYEPDTSAARSIAPGSTVCAVVMAVANGQTTRSAPLHVIMRGAPAFATPPTTSVSRRTVSFSGVIKDAGMRGQATVALYTGAATDSENTLVATEEPVTVSSGGVFTFVHTFPDFETSYKWQIRAVSTSAGAAAMRETRSAVGNVTTLDSTTYTWTGRGGDGLWTNPSNWRDNRDGDCLGYPDSASASAVFPALGAPYAVEVPQDLSVKKMTFDSPDVTLAGVGASLPKITPAENSAFGKMTLDHVEVYRFADHAIAAGQTIHLRNGAKATINNCKLNAAGGTSLIKLEGGSTFQANGLWLGCGNELVIDDSEFISTAAICLGDTADGGKIVFKGAAPKMTLRGTAFCGANMNGSNVPLEFHLPAGGYASAPITTTGNYYFFGAPNGAKTGNVTLHVVSAEGDGTGEYTCPLVVWQKGLDTNGHLILGSLPASASSASFAFADEMTGQTWADGSTVSATAKSLGVHIVAPQTEAPAWTDYTSPDGFWSAVADGEGNVVFTFNGGESALLRHWQDGHGRYLGSTATITLPVEEAAGIIPVFSRVWHVAANGNDANDGATEATAKATLGAGYALLSSVGDRLHVHPGAYLNETSMYTTNGWQIIGVGGASATTINVASNFTSFRFVKVNGGDMGVVRGFTIAPANGVRQAHQAVKQNGWGLFADCVVTNLGTTKDDVAIRQETVDCIISNCVFHGCQSSGATGSAIQQWTAGKVIDCKFFDCAGSNGRYGGAVTVGNAGSVVRGCLFVNCANTETGGAISFYGAGLVENCTIIGCRSTGTTTGAGGIDVFGSPGTVRNCIVYGCGNDAGEANINATKGIAVEYTATAPLFDGAGNILLAAMPKFVDAAGGDYRVTAGATIDSGLNQSWMADAPDLAGNPRLQNGAVDMGAYEYDPVGAPLSVSIVASDVAALLGSPITLSANVMPADATGLTYSWTVTDHNTGATVLTRSGADCATFAYAYPLGQYDVAVTVADGQSQTASDTLENLFSVKPETVWVNNAATETYPYDTKATGFTNTVDAVAFAENGMTIILADGVQTNKIADVILFKAVTMRGESGAASAILQTTKMVTLNHQDAAVRGLTLRSDYVHHGTYVRVGSGTLDSCVVTNWNRNYDTISIGSGGLVTNCLVTGNKVTANDNLVDVDEGRMVDSAIIGNKTTGGNYNASVRVTSGLVRGCLVADNETKSGGTSKGAAIYLDGTGTVESTTVANNTDIGADMNPAIGVNNANGVVRNCIVAGNTNLDGPAGVGGAYGALCTSYTLCDVAGLTGAGCKTEADLASVFKKYAVGDYHLRSGSPAINAGSNQDWMEDAIDLDGAPRIFGRQVDMGCYEFPNGFGTVIIMR